MWCASLRLWLQRDENKGFTANGFRRIETDRNRRRCAASHPHAPHAPAAKSNEREEQQRGQSEREQRGSGAVCLARAPDQLSSLGLSSGLGLRCSSDDHEQASHPTNNHTNFIRRLHCCCHAPLCAVVKLVCVFESAMMSTSSAAAGAPATGPAAALPPAPTAAWKREQAQRAKASEPQSWGEAVRRYDGARTAPANHAALLSPTVPLKQGQFNSTLVLSAFNPVAQVYTSAAKEAAVLRAEREALASLQSQAAWRRDHLANHRGFELLSGVRVPTTNAEVDALLTRQDESHATKIREVVDPLTGAPKRVVEFNYPPTHPRPRDYDIVTTHDRFVESGARLAAEDYRSRPGQGGPKWDREARDINILSNRYQTPGVGARADDRPVHEPRAAREAAEEAAMLRERYFALRHYDPLKVQFVHPEEEKRYQAEKASSMAAHGQLQLAGLPPKAKRSEGRLYDIVAPVRVKDPAQLAAFYEQPERLRRQRHQLPFEHNRLVAARDEHKEHVASAASANRISTRRYEQQFQRGHDILSNEPLSSTTLGAFAPTAHLAGAAKRAQLQAPGKPPAGKVS